MKWGVRLSSEQRPAMARRALEIFRTAKSKNQALNEIASELDVSTCTARNLIAAGGRLEKAEAGE